MFIFCLNYLFLSYSVLRILHIFHVLVFYLLDRKFANIFSYSQLFFHPFIPVLNRAKVFNFESVHFFSFSFYRSCFWCHLRTTCLVLHIKDFFSWFVSVSFFLKSFCFCILFDLWSTFRNFFCIWCLRLISWFFFLFLLPFFSHWPSTGFTFEVSILLPLNFICIFVKNRLVCFVGLFLGSLPLLCCLFHQ